jgi:hypothetical protein
MGVNQEYGHVDDERFRTTLQVLSELACENEQSGDDLVRLQWYTLIGCRGVVHAAWMARRYPPFIGRLGDELEEIAGAS